MEERWYTTDVLGFVRREIGRAVWPLRLAFIFMGLIVAGAVWRGIIDLKLGADWLLDMVVPFGLGIVLVLVLVVPHELLHGVAFKVLGAKTVKYGAEWKQLVFHASAPGFVLTPRGMDFVALLPFLVLTPPLLYTAIAAAAWWAWLAIGALLMHTQGCLGDFAMVNYFARRKKAREDVLTFDEESGESFVIVCRIQDQLSQRDMKPNA